MGVPLIAPELSALCRRIDGRALSMEEYEALLVRAEQLEALAIGGEPTESGLPLVAAWLALSQLYAQRGLINGQVAGLVEAELFEHGNRASRIAAKLMHHRRYAAELARRREPTP
jgi:hypothetical protein